MKSTASLAPRDYVWFRKPIKNRALEPKRDVSLADAQQIKRRAVGGG